MTTGAKKQDISAETRMRIFLQYPFQVFTAIHSGHGGRGQMICLDNLIGTITIKDDRLKYDVFIEFLSIELKPLGGISDEDLKQITSIAQKKYTAGELTRLFELMEAVRHGEAEFNHFWPHCIMEITDYLRSRGYALPWGEYSVDQLVEAGIFKLTDK